MVTVAKKRLAIFFSIAAVAIIQLVLVPQMMPWRRQVPGDAAVPPAPLPAGASVASAGESPPGKATRPLSARLVGHNCSAEDLQRAREFVPGRLDVALPRFLKDYAEFHRKQMGEWMRDEPGARNVKFLVYVCEFGHCGGLGDRFKGMIGAFYLAVVTRRVFVIQHPGTPLADYLAPHGVDWASAAGCVGEYTSPGATLLDALFPPRRNHPRYTQNRAQEGVFERLDGTLLVSDALATVPIFHVMLNLPAWDSILDSPAAKKAMEAREGTPWDPPSGPRFAWAWHLLFRPSPAVERHMAEMRGALHLPSDGSPWVATHMRVGRSSEFKDVMGSPVFCSIDEGSQEYAACAASLAGIIARPPFVRPGVELDPSSVPVFIASDNQAAVERMHAHLVGAGHKDEAVVYTGRKSVHVDLLVGRNATDDQSEFMHTLAELLLLSQATCLAVGAISGFSLVAMLLSQDLLTGARCYTANVGFTEGVCTLVAATDPRALAVGAAARGAMVNHGGFDHATVGPDHRVSMRQCSQITLHGHGRVCPTPLAVDVVVHAVITGKNVAMLKFASWQLNGMQALFSMQLGVHVPCRVDFMFARRGMERETIDASAHALDFFVTITAYVNDRPMQLAVKEHAEKIASFLNGMVGTIFAQVLAHGYFTRMLPGANITMIG